MFKDTVEFIRQLYQTAEFIPLHEPRFSGNERAYVMDAIDSTFVSSVGAYVDRFENEFAAYTGAKFAIATVNGTAALHIALKLADVQPGDEVITQPLTFIATCNAISYCQATPVFIDVDRETMGLSPEKLEQWLQDNCRSDEQGCVNLSTGRIVRACVPMHTFGHPADIEGLARVCERYGITLVEDAAESLGSFVGDRHSGNFGKVAAFSFNGNKTITTGGGGMITTDDPSLAARAKHLTTTAKVPHKWAYAHDEIGFNYRLPNLNAALGCAQLEQLPGYIERKRWLASQYQTFFETQGIAFKVERSGTHSNYWLNALVLESAEQRDQFLGISNAAGVMTRPIWQLMSRLPMFADCQHGDLENALWLEQRVVNIPSSVILEG
ncbi:MAG: LegC family aminotransferase [Halopseudomonas sp.]